MPDLLRTGAPPPVWVPTTTRAHARFVLVVIMLVFAHQSRTTTLDAQSATDVVLRVDVAVSHATFSGTGQPLAPSLAPTRFRLERVRDGSSWRTILTYLQASGAQATSERANPLDGARIEVADHGAATRVFDKDGRLNTRLSHTGEGAGLQTADGSVRWLEGVVADPRRSDERRRALRRTYGAAQGRVRGLDRYTSRDGDVVEEVLTDPDSSLVMAINRVRGGGLERRIAIEYARTSDGVLYRRSMRTEEPLNGDPDGRSVVTVTLSNLVIGVER